MALVVYDNNDKCVKCGKSIPNDSIFCPYCAAKQIKEPRTRSRGNGQGCVYKRGSHWTAIVTVGYELDGDKLVRKTRSQTFTRKSDAIAALPDLKKLPCSEKRKPITFQSAYDKWLPTHTASKSTMDCYKAAWRYFADLKFCPVSEIDIESLQECLDSCDKGKRTKENMKALCGLIYKYLIPRGYLPEKLNLAEYLKVTAESSEHREGFTAEQINSLFAHKDFPYTGYIISMIYTGFRPNEFLKLKIENYDPVNHTVRGGSKTDAGKNRLVPISDKILPFVTAAIGGRKSGVIFSKDGKPFLLKNFTQQVFYPVLENAGIENPIIDGKHKYSPHSCRHTFATLMKGVNAPAKDKQTLIGHTSEEMLKYYQDVSLDDLKLIISQI